MRALLVGAALFLVSCNDSDLVLMRQSDVDKMYDVIQRYHIAASDLKDLAKEQQEYIIKLQNKCYGSEI